MRGDAKLAVAYLRRSKEKRDGTQLGLDAQRDMCEAWATRESTCILAIHVDDDVSGSVQWDDRPGLLGALSDVRDHRAGVLLVAKRDRLARGLSDGTVALIHREVALHGAIVIAADGVGNGATPNDLLMRNVIDAFAEHERAMIAARTRAALAQKRLRGEKTGGPPPYGFDASQGILVAREDEQDVIRRIRTLRQVDGLSTAQIVRTLDREGVRNRSGKPLQWNSVSRILLQVG